MEHMLTEIGLRMTYLRHPQANDALDQDQILDDLLDGAEADAPLSWLTRADFSDYDHLILASHRHTGRHVAVLGARDGATSREDFLVLETAYVAQAARGRGVMGRMVALALLRIASFGPVPQVLVAPTSNPNWYTGLRKLSRRFTGAVFFPDTDSQAIRLDSAGLARRIAREIGPNLRFEAATGTLRGALALAALGPVPHDYAWPVSSDPRIDALFGKCLAPADLTLTTLDLRSETEAVILDEARRLYRAG